MCIRDRSKPGLVTQEMVRKMNKEPVIFALANPNPEISPEDARQAGAKVIGTGRSDYSNQVNLSLIHIFLSLFLL